MALALAVHIDFDVALPFAPQRPCRRFASGGAVALGRRAFALAIVQDVEEGLPQALQDAVIPVVRLGP